MKRQGETEANPRFAQLNGQLMAIQRAQALKSQQAQQMQAHQQHPTQGQQQQQQPRPGDAAGQQSSPVMNVPQRQHENGQVNGINVVQHQLTLGAHPQPRMAMPQAFTPDQLNLLKNQILAFKKISKNLPLPEQVHQTVMAPLRTSSQPPEQQTSLPQQQQLQATTRNPVLPSPNRSTYTSPSRNS
jgi:ATP-dependent helicase STH1/SNF2